MVSVNRYYCTVLAIDSAVSLSLPGVAVWPSPAYQPPVCQHTPVPDHSHMAWHCCASVLSHWSSCAEDQITCMPNEGKLLIASHIVYMVLIQSAECWREAILEVIWPRFTSSLGYISKKVLHVLAVGGYISKKVLHVLAVGGYISNRVLHVLVACYQ